MAVVEPAEQTEPAAQPTDEVPRFSEPGQEEAYLAASELLLHPPRVQDKTRVMLSTLGIFMLTSVVMGGSLTSLALVIGVLVLHELGHAAAMLVFGYTDVRIFFIPMFGAAASGRRRGVARWKHGVVLLMGPLPGLILGTVLLLMGSEGSLRTVALWLAAINAFNLLPIAPFDGGQLLSLVVFSRHRHLEIVFLAVASLALFALAVWMKSWVFGVVGGFMVLSLPLRKRVLAAGAALREEGLPEDPHALTDAQRRVLFQAMWRSMPPQWLGKPHPQASTMAGILDNATQRPTSLVATIALFVGWLAGLALTAVACIALVVTRPASWKAYQDKAGRFTIEFPSKPVEQALPGTTKGTQQISAHLGLNHAYSVSWSAGIDAAKWGAAVRTSILAMGKLIREVPMPDGDPAIVVNLKGHVEWVLLRTSGTTGYIVDVAAEQDEPESERVIRSFHLRPLDPWTP